MEKFVEVPVENIVERPVYIDNIIEKRIEKLVEVPIRHEEVIEIPIEEITERIHEVEAIEPIYIE